jgi:uncharacterized protein YecE (DUF72 family)
MATFYLGTQGFAYRDWVGSFYPAHTRSEDYLTHYAQHFRAVEIDSTFYGIPRAATIQSWYERTPPDFIFTAKFPRVITHDKKLIAAEAETHDFLTAMAGLREKCGPLVLQFMYDFEATSAPELDRYLAALPRSFRYVVEFRHKSWLQPQYWDLLEKHRSALCLNDLYYLPKLTQVTADFAYLRWLGNRKQLQRFDRLQIDRSKEQAWWSGVVKTLLGRGLTAYGFFNNAWAGYAPDSARQFLELIVGKS